jgi:hypothetical protein
MASWHAAAAVVGSHDLADIGLAQHRRVESVSKFFASSTEIRRNAMSVAIACKPFTGKVLVKATPSSRVSRSARVVVRAEKDQVRASKTMYIRKREL